jgi:hypothetical protein
MNLKTQNGMTLINDEDLKCLHNMKCLFHRFRDTNAIMFQYMKNGKPIDNLSSKLWRISDEIMIEMKRLEGLND